MSEYKTIDLAEISTQLAHHFLLSAVAPRPICFASTIDKNGKVNLSPFSYFNVFSANPPILIFSPARRGRDNTTKHTYQNILEVPEVTINIVNHPIVEQMSLASTEYDKGVNEFIKAGFTEIPSTKIKPPRVGESPVAFECKVNDVIPLGTEGGAGNLVIAEILLMHVQTKYLNKEGKIDTPKIDFVARMGGNYYARMVPEALFEIEKPIAKKGIGIDNLPKSVRESKVLTGNDLGKLGNMENLPLQKDLVDLKAEPAIRQLLEKGQGHDYFHQIAKEAIEEGNIQRALNILCLSAQINSA